MKNMIKLGLLSTLLSATLLADIKVDSFTEVVSPTQTDINFVLRDTETGEPINRDIGFTQLSVDAGAKIDGMNVLSGGAYFFNILTTSGGCKKSANSEVKGVFSTTIGGKKVQVPYSLCKEKEVKDHFETDHPYKNNAKQDQVLFAKLKPNADGEFGGGYTITIEGETEVQWDSITFTDMSGKVLKAKVYDIVTDKLGKTQELIFSGKLKKSFHLKGPESGLEIKVHFTSDGSVTKEGVKVDMEATLVTP